MKNNHKIFTSIQGELKETKDPALNNPTGNSSGLRMASVKANELKAIVAIATIKVHILFCAL